MEGINTVEDFAQAMAAADEPEGTEAQEVEHAQPEEVEAQNDDQPEQEQEEAEADESTDPDEPESDQPEAESLDDKVVTWETASGEKFEVPVAELKQGYMRNQDYTHKTQQLAKEREIVQQEVQQQFQRAEEFAQELGALHAQNSYIQQLEAALGQIDRNTDPVTYNTVANDLILARQQRSDLAGRIAQVQQQRTYAQQQAMLEAQKQAVAELSAGPNAIPGFGKELVHKLNQTGRDYGFSDQELAMTTDPRYLRVLHDAMQWREAQAKKPEVVKKVKQAPPKPAKQTASRPASDIEKTVKQFKSKPTLDGLAALLAQQYKG
ncbi:hypothetical protein [Cupriavidus gilardii]|uniref:hypothetical protein n=1 Tax=Cupriavidus gilardii TaxID=82541 RepID=UPI0021C1A4C1|nr:hypothetical protein [Cupriavidus gilardii]MCT9125406.1 hypothetical protein [Cupriavidus gilardii]